MLLRDVKRLGKAGEIKRVADGYARNYLIPRKLAVMVTESTIQQVRAKLQAEARRREKEITTAQSLAERLPQITLTFKVKAGEKGQLYGSITNADIATSLEKEIGQKFDKRKVLLEEPLRHLGSYKVPVKLATDIVPEVTVVLEAEE